MLLQKRSRVPGVRALSENTRANRNRFRWQPGLTFEVPSVKRVREQGGHIDDHAVHAHVRVGRPQGHEALRPVLRGRERPRAHARALGARVSDPRVGQLSVPGGRRRGCEIVEPALANAEVLDREARVGEYEVEARGVDRERAGRERGGEESEEVVFGEESVRVVGCCA